MHIPENYLSPSTCAVMGAVMVPVWRLTIQKMKEEVPKEKMPLVGIGAAFVFLGMMFNVPLPGGTTGHAVGGTLLAILLGPYAACLAVSISLLIQAVLFGDGGILAFGANAFNMAFVLPFVGYGVYSRLKMYFSSHRGEYIAAAIGAYVGINAAALCAAIEFGIQPLLFTDAAGQALYCPYSLVITIPAMLMGHLTLFGFAEAFFTTAVLTYVRRTAPELLDNSRHYAWRKSTGKALYGLMGLLICLTPLGLLAEGTAWGEWDPSELAQLTESGKALGYIPAGFTEGFSFSAFFPDYSIGALPEASSYVLSAVIGAALVIIIFKVAASFMKDRFDGPPISREANVR